MSYTHKRSYKKNFLAYNWDGAAWNGKPKWDGPCKWRPLPAASPLPARNDSRMTGLRFHKSCWLTKSKYHVEKDDFQFKPLFHFRWFGSYNMRKISQKSTPIFLFLLLYDPKPLKVQGFGTFWKTKSNWEKINTERRKCSPLIFAAAAIFPSYFHGGIKARESNVKMEKKPEGAPRLGTPSGYSNSLFSLQQPPQIQIIQQKAGADGTDACVQPASQLQHGLLSSR